MGIEDSSEKPIRNIDEWASLYDTPQSSRQWKKGRSAHSVAEFVLEQNGLDLIASRVSAILGTAVVIEKAIPELEVRFDEYGRGRVHDLGIYARTESGESVFIGVEAKVDESFGGKVLETYLDAKAKQIYGVSTNAPQRIESLLSQHFHEPTREMFDVRYQLLYATVGTLAANADHAVLFVIVFRTNSYYETKSAENYRDYVYFMEKVSAIPIKVPNSPAQGHQIKFSERPLICLYEYCDI